MITVANGAMTAGTRPIRTKYLIAAVLASVSAVGIGLLPASPAAAQNHAETPYGTFSEICGLAGGTASRNWPATRLTCRFGDGSIVWCTPSMRRCGHTKAASPSRRSSSGARAERIIAQLHG